MNNDFIEKTLLCVLTGLAAALTIIGIICAFGIAFGESKNPTANEYIKMKVRIKMLEKQNRLLHEGWDSCVQDYQRLMNDCSQACKI